MLSCIARLFTRLDQGDAERTFGAMRSNKWPKVRAAHLRDYPTCAVCGRKELLNVHHIQPFHLYPELELDPFNLLTLCEGATTNCHFRWGHLDDWSSWNPFVRTDAALWLAKIRQRTK
jgi:5-methylcytosine-specific restriction enzyme A